MPVLEVTPAGEPFFRVHRSEHAPAFFGPGEGRPATGRFDPASGRFGVLYAGLSLNAAVAETLLRSPQRRLVAFREVTVRSLSLLRPATTLRLVHLQGPHLQELGTDASIATGPYGPCGLWADALFDHPDAPDGIAYTSRHNPDELCAALFRRAERHPALGVVSTTPLLALGTELAMVLRRHGKGLEIP
ncbi:RES family NAD+ phosphorylase [Siccirubricoccus sp. G192]|uniref:RES family NAD+ phosphorylase n=1 Tax=Siccirubricoccus sp. G192 TaxID=2849651 RepID=UPI0020C3D0D8|nr:RES family NAD+ phosphorylase [Siccirubricoccus sp. G192]